MAYIRIGGRRYGADLANVVSLPDANAVGIGERGEACTAQFIAPYELVPACGQVADWVDRAAVMASSA